MADQSALGPVELNSSNTSVTILTLQRAGVVGLQVTANTDLTFSITGSQDGSTFTNLPAVEQGGTAYAEGATITAAAGQLIFISAASLGAIKITRVTGTGTISLRASHASYLDTLAAGGAVLGVVDTELPTAAALNGTWAKTTVAPIIGAGVMANDGTNLVLIGGEATNGLDVDVTRLPAGTNTIGATMPALREVAVTFTIDNANALDANDVAVAGDIIAACVSANDANGYLVAFQLLDGDDNTAAGYNVFFFSNNVTLGTIDAAISISDADAAHIIGAVAIAAGDWYDLINSKCCDKTMSHAGLPLAITPKAGTDDIYVGIQCLGTPTFTTGSFKGRFWFQDCV